MSVGKPVFPSDKERDLGCSKIRAVKDLVEKFWVSGLEVRFEGSGFEVLC